MSERETYRETVLARLHELQSAGFVCDLAAARVYREQSEPGTPLYSLCRTIKRHSSMRSVHQFAERNWEELKKRDPVQPPPNPKLDELRAAYEALSPDIADDHPHVERLMRAIEAVLGLPKRETQ